MREVLNYVTRGPWQAALVALLTALVPLMFWFSAAVVALITLRKGVSQGLVVLMWALIPAIGWIIATHDPGVLIVLLLSYAMAVILRRTVALDKALALGVLTTLLAAWALPLLVPDLIQTLVAMVREVFKQLPPEVLQQGGLTADSPAMDEIYRVFMVASLVSTYFGLAIGSLLLARSWQARLYNPGGFGSEFYQLRSKPPMLLAAFAITLLAPQVGISSITVVLVISVALSVVAVALVHGLVAGRNLGSTWLFVFYAALFLLGPGVMLALVVLAILDSLMDFRSRNIKKV